MIFFDLPAGAYFAANNGGNGGAASLNANPGGPFPVQTISAPATTVLQKGVNPWSGAATPILGVLSVSRDFATPNVQSFSLNVQQGLWNNSTLQVGYVGTLGRKLVWTRNINAAVPGTGAVQQRRPFFAQYPTLGAINQLETAANSTYSSLQVQFTQPPAWSDSKACLSIREGDRLRLGRAKHRPIEPLQRSTRLRPG